MQCHWHYWCFAKVLQALKRCGRICGQSSDSNNPAARHGEGNVQSTSSAQGSNIPHNVCQPNVEDIKNFAHCDLRQGSHFCLRAFCKWVAVLVKKNTLEHGLQRR